MNAPCTFSIQNNGISQYFDVSYLDFTRSGDTSVLKQNQKTPFSETIKKYQPTNNYLEEVNRIRFKHDMHRLVMSKKGKTIKELGTLSRNQVKSCKKACETMINTVIYSREKTVNYKTGQYVTFVTLTLPTKQMHSDSEIRRLQTRYIENLQKTYGVKYYVWKAEAQKNGNIHFHLLVDKWIHWTIHRKLWNKQIDKLGYLDAYFEKHGNRNPNTTQVDSLKMDKRKRKLKNITTYVIKYMTKLEFGKRPILGKLWGCSLATKNLDYPKYTEGFPLFDHVVSFVNKGFLKQVLKEDFFSFFSGKSYRYISRNYKPLWDDIKQHFQLQNGNITPNTLQQKEFIRTKNYTPPEKVVIPKIEILAKPTLEQAKINFGNAAFWTNNLK
ncbi:rolling circle replication-associated protein [Tenacibaculum amylolyticum]|uniref:rolling circle replication-associated protein n=1 Tax=Tenacibaculum amylolyticum TaxID=104269 RepID=UPI003894B78F